jgi:hypothetical protein
MMEMDRLVWTLDAPDGVGLLTAKEWSNDTHGFYFPVRPAICGFHCGKKVFA